MHRAPPAREAIALISASDTSGRQAPGKERVEGPSSCASTDHSSSGTRVEAVKRVVEGVEACRQRSRAGCG